jgi:hypothetical protein
MHTLEYFGKNSPTILYCVSVTGLPWKDVHKVILSFFSVHSLKFSNILELILFLFIQVRISWRVSVEGIASYFIRSSLHWVHFFFELMTPLLYFDPHSVHFNQTKKSDSLLPCLGASYITFQSDCFVVVYMPFLH